MTKESKNLEPNVSESDVTSGVTGDVTSDVTGDVTSDVVKKRKKKRNVEPMLQEDINRFTLFPIKYNDLWSALQNSRSCILDSGRD